MIRGSVGDSLRRAEPGVTSELHRAFTHYDADDVKCALVASMNLFRRISVETSERLNYVYPRDADERIREWVELTLEMHGR